MYHNRSLIQLNDVRVNWDMAEHDGQLSHLSERHTWNVNEEQENVRNPRRQRGPLWWVLSQCLNRWTNMKLAYDSILVCSFNNQSFSPTWSIYQQSMITVSTVTQSSMFLPSSWPCSSPVVIFTDVNWDFGLSTWPVSDQQTLLFVLQRCWFRLLTCMGMTRIVASIHRRHRQHKTVFSCLAGVCGVNWIGDKSKLSATENFGNSFVQSRSAVWTESCLVLAQFPIHNVVTYCDVDIWKLGQD